MIKVQNAGYFTIPTAPTWGTSVTTSTTSNTYGSWTQIEASRADDAYLLGLSVVADQGNSLSNVTVQLGTGASGSESAISTFVFPTVQTGQGASVAPGMPLLPMPVLIRAGTRIAARTADALGGTSRAEKITLLMVKALDIDEGGDSVVATRTVLSQASPAASTVTDLYTATGTGIGSVTVSNSNSSPVTVSVSFAPGGAADTGSQYLYTNVPVGAGATATLPLGISPTSGDKVRIKASATGVSFTLFSS